MQLLCVESPFESSEFAWLVELTGLTARTNRSQIKPDTVRTVEIVWSSDCLKSTGSVFIRFCILDMRKRERERRPVRDVRKSGG